MCIVELQQKCIMFTEYRFLYLSFRDTMPGTDIKRVMFQYTNSGLRYSKVSRD